MMLDLKDAVEAMMDAEGHMRVGWFSNGYYYRVAVECISPADEDTEVEEDEVE